MLPIASFKNAGTEMILERFTLTCFIANGKREFVPRDQVLLLLDFYKIRVVWDSFYLLIYYFESTTAVNVTLKFRYPFRRLLRRLKKYSGTPPYGHLGNMVTSLLRPLFFGRPAKRPYIFL